MLGVLGNEVRSDYPLAANEEKQRKEKAKRTRIAIAKATEQLERTNVAEPTNKQVETVNGKRLDGAKRPRRSSYPEMSGQKSE